MCGESVKHSLCEETHLSQYGKQECVLCQLASLNNIEGGPFVYFSENLIGYSWKSNVEPSNSPPTHLSSHFSVWVTFITQSSACVVYLLFLFWPAVYLFGYRAVLPHSCSQSVSSLFIHTLLSPFYSSSPLLHSPLFLIIIRVILAKITLQPQRTFI